MIIDINDVKYKVIKDDDKTVNVSMLNEMMTDYFNSYDYIVGDWAYSKLRLKGFNKKNNKFYKEINDYNKLDSYIKNNCAYGCKYFVLEKLENKE
jgi:uncharacterized protein YutD